MRLAQTYKLNPVELRRSAEAVARYREVELRPIGEVVDGYGAVGQAKWAGWRRGQQVEEITEPYLDAQMTHAAAALDPIFSGDPAPTPQEESRPTPTVRMSSPAASDPFSMNRGKTTQRSTRGSFAPKRRDEASGFELSED